MSMNMIYRAKRTDNNKWVEGYYVFDNGDLIVKDLRTIVRGLAEHVNAYLVKPETIGRAVGRNDKNGISIFEGDVLAYFSEWKYIVRYGEFNGQVGLGYYYGLGFYLERVGAPEHKVPFSSISCDKGEYEVVGNIHDNKELLNYEE